MSPENISEPVHRGRKLAKSATAIALSLGLILSSPLAASAAQNKYFEGALGRLATRSSGDNLRTVGGAIYPSSEAPFNYIQTKSSAGNIVAFSISGAGQQSMIHQPYTGKSTCFWNNQPSPNPPVGTTQYPACYRTS